VCHHINGGVGLVADDRPRPRLHGVKGYGHADRPHIHAMGHEQSTTVDRCVLIVAEMDECVDQ
jgi:hypothetical protein